MARLGLLPAPAALDDLLRRYGEPHRHYHNLSHLTQVLTMIDAWVHQAPAADLVRLAAWFHDAVYDPRAADNEERSADLAGTWLAPSGLDTPRVESVQQLIQCTKTHQAGDDANAQVLLDADLSILGAAADDYDRYAAAIRQEYAWVPEPDYRTGRRQVLERFLNRPHIYFTQEARSTLEAMARANLRREVDRLA
jgi:predicted metal-dependent HD superfamily phosphohydrolase